MTNEDRVLKLIQVVRQYAHLGSYPYALSSTYLPKEVLEEVKNVLDQMKPEPQPEQEADVSVAMALVGDIRGEEFKTDPQPKAELPGGVRREPDFSTRFGDDGPTG